LSYFTKKLRELLLQICPTDFIILKCLLSQANSFSDYWSELSLDIPFVIKDQLRIVNQKKKSETSKQIGQRDYPPEIENYLILL